MVPARQPRPPDTSTATCLIEVECQLRQAGRLLELVGVNDTESARLAGIVFRLASRVRTDRLAVPS